MSTLASSALSLSDAGKIGTLHFSPYRILNLCGSCCVACHSEATLQTFVESVKGDTFGIISLFSQGCVVLFLGSGGSDRCRLWTPALKSTGEQREWTQNRPAAGVQGSEWCQSLAQWEQKEGLLLPARNTVC